MRGESDFIVGVTLSGRVAEHGRELLEPIRDVFGGLFFVFFGLQIDPATLPEMIVPAVGLAAVTAGTKIFTGWWASRRAGIVVTIQPDPAVLRGTVWIPFNQPGGTVGELIDCDAPAIDVRIENL